MIRRLSEFRVNWKNLAIRFSLFVLAVLVILWITGGFRNRAILFAVLGGVAVFAVLAAGFWRIVGWVEPTIWPTQVRTCDDRQRKVVTGEVNLKEISFDPFEHWRFSRWVSTRKQPVLNRTSVNVIIWAVLFGVWLTWTRVGSGWLGRDAALYGGIAVMIVVGYALRRTQRIVNIKYVSDALLFTGRCCVCGEDLKTRAPESDGCTICAECGSAWNLDKRMPKD